MRTITPHSRQPGLSNRTSSRLPDVSDVVRSRTFGHPVGRSVREVKLQLLGGSGERFRLLNLYADDVDARSLQDQRWRGPICRSRPTNPTAFRPSVRLRRQRGRSRSTRLRACPLDQTGCARVRPIGRPRGPADRPSERSRSRAVRSDGLNS